MGLQSSSCCSPCICILAGLYLYDNEHFLADGCKTSYSNKLSMFQNFPSNRSHVLGKVYIFLICTEAPLGQALALVVKARGWKYNVIGAGGGPNHIMGSVLLHLTVHVMYCAAVGSS